MSDRPNKWAPVEGLWQIEKGHLTFLGERVKFDDQSGVSVGLAISDRRFAGGEISADFEFESVEERTSGEIVFYHDPDKQWFISAGLGGSSSMYAIRHWDGRWVTHAAVGDRRNLQPARKYHVRVSIAGSRVGLAVDGVDVLRTVLPFSLQSSFVGVKCFDANTQHVKNFLVDGKKGRVFVVMQFSSPYNEIHTEVIQRICADFELMAVRADDVFGPGLIIADIAREITESEFVIAEVTPSNPNVYYELGYAHAINKPAILLADRAAAKLPFDVAPFRTLFYDNTIAGKRTFEDSLKKHITAILATGFTGA